jgi:hypothetical protein
MNNIYKPKKKNNNNIDLKESIIMKNKNMLKAYSKIIPERFKEKKEIKKNKDKFFIKK